MIAEAEVPPGGRAATQSRPFRVALVIPWFGPDLRGGAEQEAWQLATRLSNRGHTVDVLTTRCRSFFHDWGRDHWPAGPTEEHGIVVRRFSVARRNRQLFDELNRQLLAIAPLQLQPGISPVAPEKAAVWTRENINSPELERYIASNRNDYDVILFLPYLYGPTLCGLSHAGRIGWMQPCLHDEVYAYLPEVADAFRQAQCLLFNSDGELEVAVRIFGPAIRVKSHVVGAGIEVSGLEPNNAVALPPQVGEAPFFLCLGRRDPEKGIDRLINAYCEFRRHFPRSAMQMVLAGPGNRSYASPALAIIDLGLVEDDVKAALLRSCSVLCQPSTNESFSRVLFEAWYCGRPVIVDADCIATKIAVEDSGGGWIARAAEGWGAALAIVHRATDVELAEAGNRGKRYAHRIADWERVLDRYESLFASELPQRMEIGEAAIRTRAVHQLLPGFAFGDAISNNAIFVRDQLRALGYRSQIFASNVGASVANECLRYSKRAIAHDDCLIYHHSIGTKLTEAAIRHPGPKCLVYHNITPAEFFAPFSSQLARLLRNGREQMWQLARAFPYSVGDSRFNAAELAVFGFASPGVVPLVVDPHQWKEAPDAALMNTLQDGVRNLLFVGRIAPNKCQHELVEAFRHYRDHEEARLLLVGACGANDAYGQFVRRRIADLDLAADVKLVGQCSRAALHAYYRTAHLFWCLSEHEGFCVPLIEAMCFDIPVLAYGCAGVAETLGEAGILLRDKRDCVAMARLAFKAASDPEFRQGLIRGQRSRRDAYAPVRVRPAVDAMIDRLTGSA
jgi:glycosyltransferase involved in cell wall biosynthesis